MAETTITTVETFKDIVERTSTYTIETVILSMGTAQVLFVKINNSDKRPATEYERNEFLSALTPNQK